MDGDLDVYRPLPSTADYQATYDLLYEQHDYHSDGNYSHENALVDLFSRLAATLETSGEAVLRSAVVLGCSHGMGVEMLHRHGVQAWGVDVAKRAIEMAKQLRGNTCEISPDQCFVQSSLTKLPFAADSFDVGLSADVLEHLAPNDVPKAVREISRVVKYFLLLDIAPTVEGGKNGERVGIDNLHLTTEDSDWWISAFAAGGWRVHENASDATTTRLVLRK